MKETDSFLIHHKHNSFLRPWFDIVRFILKPQNPRGQYAAVKRNLPIDCTAKSYLVAHRDRSIAKESIQHTRRFNMCRFKAFNFQIIQYVF